MRTRRVFLSAVWLTLGLGLATGVARTQNPAEPQRGFGDVAPVANETIPRDEGAVRGMVIDDRTGRAVGQATIQLVATFGSREMRSTVTDDRGRYTLRGLVPGVYQVYDAADGYLSQRVLPDGDGRPSRHHRPRGRRCRG